MTRKAPNETQIVNSARALSRAIRRWKMIQASGNDHLVFEFPPSNPSVSPPEGEPCRFWRFASKQDAESFRDRKIMEGVMPSLSANGLIE